MEYDVALKRLDINTLIDIQGDPDKVATWAGGKLPPFPNSPNTASESNGVSLYWIGQRRWLVRAEIENEQSLLSMLKLETAPTEISAVSTSDTQQFFSIRGPDADQIISVACPMDCHLSKFPKNGVSYTDILGIKGLIIRQAQGFDIGVERSFADMVEDYLARI